VIRFIWTDPALRALVVFPTLAVLIVGPLVPIVLPVLARQVFDDPIMLGVMVASYGVGGLLGTAGYGVIGRRIARGRLYRAIFIVWPLAFGAIAVFTSPTLTLAMLLVIGIAAGALVPLQATIRQERAPAELLARVVGLSTASIPVAAPIGVVVTGALIDVAGLHPALLLLSVGAAVIGALALVSRATSRFDPSENAEGAYR
jgi:MFS family permease